LKKYIAILVSLFVFIFGSYSIHNTFLLNDYLETSSSQKVDILIESGDTGTEIAEKLYKSGVIKASKMFYKLAISEKRSNSISPGIHEIDLKISAKAALDQLLDPKRNRGVFGFIEGLRKNEIFDLLKKSDLVSGNLSASIKPDKIYKTSNLEGFLFPAQYSFVPGTSTDAAINQMINRFNLAAKTSKIDQGFNGFSPFELVTIASIIQAEGDPQDFKKIARVIYNRLKIKMPLQMNATVDYAANLRGQIRLPYKRLEINSRYNTYKYQGLPIGPIGNPGQDALDAAVNPVSGDWLYFITVKPQDTRFTKSFKEFNLWVNEFRKNEKAGLFK
jgi:UPF0755 protein